MRDPELQAIIDSEVAAININPKIQGMLQRMFADADLKTTIKKGLGFYKEIGGDPQKVKRGIQIAVDQAIATELLGTDLPGPDALIVPKIREFVVLAIGKKFDELLAE